ncbi:MAG: non-homologous end-joining DNA ligase [Actinomycetota bacterium]
MAKDYAAKRAFEKTPEPPPQVEGNVDPGRAPSGEHFVIQQHYARRLHHDLRLEMLNGDVPVLVSWAVPRGLPRHKGEPHLAVHVEDHPVDYGSFEGTIPEGEYGAGEVRIFDSGTYELLEQDVGKLSFRLKGDRLRGVYHLNRTRSEEGKDEWLALLSKDQRPPPEPPPDPAPMLATLVRDAFDDDSYLFEFKWDGVRALAVCTEETKILSRNRRDISAGYPELAGLHDRLVCLDAILDGEIVAFEDGRPSFEKLQSRINLVNPRDVERATKSIPVAYIAFDLLYLDGRDLTPFSIEERRDLLEKVVVPSPRVQVSPAVRGEGMTLAQAARARALEGIVAKKLGSPYTTGKRVKHWLKIKVVHEADVVVGGWTRGEGGRASSFGSLLVGAYDEEGLRFLGAVGTGYSDKTLQELMPELRKLETDECPFTEDPRTLPASRFGKQIRAANWVRPELVAVVEFRELTSASRLRAPSFKHLRDDKDPSECRYDDLVPAT